MSVLKTIAGWIPGSGVVSAVSGAIQSWQNRKASEQEHKAEWEVVQAKRSSTVLRWATFAIVWGPILHTYYLVLSTTLPTDDPQAVADAVELTLNAFPPWWTGAAMTMLLAVWGIRERSHGRITEAAMRRREKQAGASSTPTEPARPGPPGGGP